MAIENIPAGKAVGAWNVNSPRNTSKNEGAEKLGWMSFQNVILQDVTPSFLASPDPGFLVKRRSPCSSFKFRESHKMQQKISVAP